CLSACSACSACNVVTLSCHTVRALTVSLLVSTALLCAAPPARAQNLHYGMNTLVLTPPMADKVVELGAGIVRVAYGWDVIEGRCKGCFDWTTTDAWRDEAK